MIVSEDAQPRTDQKKTMNDNLCQKKLAKPYNIGTKTKTPALKRSKQSKFILALAWTRLKSRNCSTNSKHARPGQKQLRARQIISGWPPKVVARLPTGARFDVLQFLQAPDVGALQSAAIRMNFAGRARLAHARDPETW